MIVAKLEELLNQVPNKPTLQKGLNYLLQARGANLSDGRCEIDGEQVYALVQSYQTLPMSEAKYEAHRSYIDIQYILSGTEVMGWAPLDQLQITQDYQPEKDILFGTCAPQSITPLVVAAGQAAVFFPEDAHAPKLALGSPAQVKKIVVKIQI